MVTSGVDNFYYFPDIFPPETPRTYAQQLPWHNQPRTFSDIAALYDQTALYPNAYSARNLYNSPLPTFNNFIRPSLFQHNNNFYDYVSPSNQDALSNTQNMARYGDFRSASQEHHVEQKAPYYQKLHWQ